MKKALSLILAVVMLAVVLVGCSSSTGTTTGTDTASTASTGTSADTGNAAATGQTFKIMAAHGAAESTTLHEGWLKFKELIEAESNGAITVDIYPNQELGGDREYTEACTQGNVDMGSPSSANMAGFDTTLNAFESPFLFSDRDTVYKVLDSEIGTKILETLDQANLKGLGYFENGFRELTTNKAINSLEDLKGLKIRVMENDIHIAIWQNLGANPSPLAFGELFTALQQKTFDAQENPLELIYNTKFYEVQDHVTMTNHIYTPYIVFMNKDYWNSMPAEYQTMVQDCLTLAVDYQRSLCADAVAACRQKINDSGKSTVYDLPEETLATFADACSPVYDMVREKAGDIADELYQAAGKNF